MVSSLGREPTGRLASPMLALSLIGLCLRMEGGSQAPRRGGQLIPVRLERPQF